MKLKLTFAVGLIVAIWITSCQKPGNPSQYLMSKIDYEFLTKAINSIDNQVYIQSFIIDSSRGRYPDGTFFNQYLPGYTYYTYRDHKAERLGLIQMATRYLTTAPDTLPDASHVALLSQLKTVSGRAFDSIYITSQANDHVSLVDIYTNEANFGLNDSIKNFSALYLSTELSHLQNTDYYKKFLLP